MRILFIGIGLSHYYNQVLNKLSSHNRIEIFNLVDIDGKSHAGKNVFETSEGVKFNIVYLKRKIFNFFSDYHYYGYSQFEDLIESIEPDIIVSAEIYLPFIFNQKIKKFIERKNIKIILKDIPFRLKHYDIAKNRILSGESDNEYIPFFIFYLIKFFEKFRLSFIVKIFQKSISFFKFDYLYRKYFGRKVLLKKLENKRMFFNLCDAHVNYVEDAFEIFGSYGVDREKIFIIYNSPDTDLLFEIRKNIEKDELILPFCKHRLIHVGRLVEWKRVDMLIKSLKGIKQRYSDAELIIIGTGPIESDLKRLVTQLNLDDSVKFIGGVYKPEELGKYLLESTIYVLAGMGGISINDAMIFGKPIICSVCDGTEKKLVYHGLNGFYFENGNLDDLTNKIFDLFDKEELIISMGEASTKIIRDKINIHLVIKGYLDAFNYVLKKNIIKQ